MKRFSFIIFIMYISIPVLLGQVEVDSTSGYVISKLDSLLNKDNFEEENLIQLLEDDERFEADKNKQNGKIVYADSLKMKMIQDSIVLIQSKNEILRESHAKDLNYIKSLKDSVQKLTVDIQKLRLRHIDSNVSFTHYRDSLQKLSVVNDSLLLVVENLQKRNKLLQPLNKELNLQIANLQATVEQQSDLLNQQIQKIKEKEQLFAEKELIYERAIQESKIDLIKLEGQLQNKNSELAGKDREIELLAENISERKSSINRRNEEIDNIRKRRQNTAQELDTLRNYVRNIEKDLILCDERLMHSNEKNKRLERQLFNLTNKKKKIRLVQGLAIRNFRAPSYKLSPESSEKPNSYVITNENTGSYEFDFVTGATFRIIDLGNKDAQYTSDVGFFLGFGGKNLFKNFYLGPNIKLFDVIHINVGVNIAEFSLLKRGFNEGDVVPQGSSIPTVRQWKLSPYLGLTFDFSLIASIAGKL